jgi:hypothetical protein
MSFLVQLGYLLIGVGLAKLVGTCKCVMSIMLTNATKFFFLKLGKAIRNVTLAVIFSY